MKMIFRIEILFFSMALLIGNVCSAFTFNAYGCVHAHNDIYITDVAGSITVNAIVSEPEIEGLPDGEYPAGENIQIMYKWSTAKCSDDGQASHLNVNADSVTLSDGHNGINGCGNYQVACEIKFKVKIDGIWQESENWMGIGSCTVSFVSVYSIFCENVASTTNTPGTNETLVIPVGYSHEPLVNAVRIAAAPAPSVAWPGEKPAWSGDIQSIDGVTAVVDTSEPGVKTVTAECGNRVSLRIIVDGRLDLQGDSNGDGSITAADDAVEMTSPGVVAVANDGDADADEIIDSADMLIAGQGGSVPPLFTELRLNVTDFVSSGDVRIHFQYDAAPATEQQGACLQNGTFRIWRKQSNEERSPLSVADGGDFVMPDFSGGSSGYTPAQIGLQLSSTPIQGTSYSMKNGTVTLWLESTGSVTDGVVCAWVEDCGDASLPASQDELKVSAISLQPGLREAEFTGGGTVPASRRTTFGLPLAVNNDHDGDDDETPNVNLALDYDDAVVNGSDDLDDMGRLTLPALPSFMPSNGTVQLSFSGSSLRFFDTGSGHDCAGTGNISLEASQLYSRLKQGSLTYYVEATGPGLVTVTMGINNSPPRPVAVIRCIGLTREFVTHDPDFEEYASRSADDNCKQRELMKHTAGVALQTLPGCYSGQVTARIMETNLNNERMGSFSFGNDGRLYLRLQQKFAPADDYEQVWLEASDSEADGTFSPLNNDWSYANRDILVEIYRGDTMLVRLPVKLKTLMKLTSFSPTVTDGKVAPQKVNPYADAITIGYDFADESPLYSAQHGYGLRVPYELSETVKTETGKPFFKIEGTGLSASPAVPRNLLKRKGLIYYYESDGEGGETRVEPQQFVKWEGFESSVGENAAAIWEYPDEAKDNGVFASPGKVASEGNYKVILGCTDRVDNTQSQKIEFEVEVNYDLAQ